MGPPAPVDKIEAKSIVGFQARSFSALQVGCWDMSGPSKVVISCFIMVYLPLIMCNRLLARPTASEVQKKIMCYLQIQYNYSNGCPMDHPVWVSYG